MTTAAFIIGPSRSGTSVLAQALGRSDQIAATEELHFYNLLQPAAEAEGAGPGWLWARLVAIQDQGRFFEIKNGTANDLPEPAATEMPPPEQPVLRAFFARLATSQGARAVVEQTPMNLYFRDEIRRDFPDVVFFLMRRDPRALIASQKNRWKVGTHGARTIPKRDIRRVRYAGHPLLQLLLLRKTLLASLAAEVEPDVVIVGYEALVRDPEAVLARLSARLDTPFDPVMIDVTDAGSSHAREGQQRGFDPARLDSWRTSLSATEIWLTERLYGPALTMPASGARPGLGELFWLVLSLPFSLLMALYYSAGGYGNLRDAAKRRFL